MLSLLSDKSTGPLQALLTTLHIFLPLQPEAWACLSHSPLPRPAAPARVSISLYFRAAPAFPPKDSIHKEFVRSFFLSYLIHSRMSFSRTSCLTQPVPRPSHHPGPAFKTLTHEPPVSPTSWSKFSINNPPLFLASLHVPGRVLPAGLQMQHRALFQLLP